MGVPVTEVFLAIGMLVISVTFIATQVPAMINDIQDVLSKESVIEKSKEVANLLTIATAAPNEITLIYSFPSSRTYDLVIKDGYVNLTSGNDSAVAKTLVRTDRFPSCPTVRNAQDQICGGGIYDGAAGHNHCHANFVPDESCSAAEYSNTEILEGYIVNWANAECPSGYVSDSDSDMCIFVKNNVLELTIVKTVEGKVEVK